ncbi:dual specificity tyrosine-phosphorylation-regulated kinase 4-like [Myripristis murdjan]|uniref:dual specificity tyrosine-phosphorylation-regulated kinase 4-like n=1 Tax=Myripristis murdjan TaxID=586833 RepID=UPI001175F5A1|nr:dual specificity tyrosine-phosphorylation-regulated kinase 4-like [Myripristis murdjan]
MKGSEAEKEKITLSISDVLQFFKKYLTEFEQEEIKGYKKVWYLGQKAKKIQGSKSLSFNSGYDTENGYYRMVIKDHIAYRFEVLEEIGRGAYGQVFKCRDHKTMELVAIKVIRNDKSIHNEAMAEVKILDALSKKDKKNTANILHMKEHFYFRNHLCITFELLGKDLYTVMKENNLQGFSLSQVQHFAKDLLACLQLLRKEGIIHCDLKPENILMSDKNHNHVKVIDFGASCFEEKKRQKCIQTRLYMSPEMLLAKGYSFPIDMWSLGCILAELHTGSPLFDGDNWNDQFGCIMEVLGEPPMELLRGARLLERFYDSQGFLKKIVNNNGAVRQPGSKNLASLLKTTDANFLDFIQRCLRFKPEERMTPEEAMQHAWIQGQLHTRKSTPKPCAADNTASAGTAHMYRKEGSLLKREKMPPVRLTFIKESVTEVMAKISTVGKERHPIQREGSRKAKERPGANGGDRGNKIRGAGGVAGGAWEGVGGQEGGERMMRRSCMVLRLRHLPQPYLS